MVGKWEVTRRTAKIQQSSHLPVTRAFQFFGSHSFDFESVLRFGKSGLTRAALWFGATQTNTFRHTFRYGPRGASSRRLRRWPMLEPVPTNRLVIGAIQEIVGIARAVLSLFVIGKGYSRAKPA